MKKFSLILLTIFTATSSFAASGIVCNDADQKNKVVELVQYQKKGYVIKVYSGNGVLAPGNIMECKIEETNGSITGFICGKGNIWALTSISDQPNLSLINAQIENNVALTLENLSKLADKVFAGNLICSRSANLKFL